MQSRGGGGQGLESSMPSGLVGFPSHISCEKKKCKSSFVVPCIRGMNMAVVILSKDPWFYMVCSFTLKSKSRLSYAIENRPVDERPFSKVHCSSTRDLTI